MAWLMFWHGQYFVAVNGLTLLMFWHSRCFGTFDIIEPLMFWCSRTNAGERQSLRDLKYQPHLYTDCTKTLTAPKHRPHHNTDNAGPKGQLVYRFAKLLPFLVSSSFPLYFLLLFLFCLFSMSLGNISIHICNMKVTFPSFLVTVYGMVPSGAQ